MDRAMIPESMGLQATPKANVGEAKSWGSELELKYTKNFNNGMWLQGTGTFTYATNEYSYYEEAPRPETPWLNHKGEKSMLIGDIWQNVYSSTNMILIILPPKFTVHNLSYQEISNIKILTETVKSIPRIG